MPKKKTETQDKKIIIKGARVHNLKNISLDLPRDQLVVITGISGSGKSSLAFDTIYAEGQRRYVESLSSYARQFLGLMDKPDVDQIDGLSPAISIDQKSTSHNPRSTVGTVTEIYDYLRLLFARAGVPHCPECGQKIEKQTKEQIIKKIIKFDIGKKIIILSPVVKDKKGEHKNMLASCLRSGYSRVRFDGDIYSIEEILDRDIDKQKKHTVEIVIDRLEVTEKTKGDSRLFQSLEVALDLANGLVTILEDETQKEHLFSQHFSCPNCNINLPEIEPRIFSFNSPHGACPECTGLGYKQEIDPDLVIPNKKLTLAEGAIRPWMKTGTNTWYMRQLEALADKNNFSIHTPVKDLNNKHLKVVLYGNGGQKLDIDYDSDNFSGSYSNSFEGVIPNLARRYKETESNYIRNEIEKYMRILSCPVCHGDRLSPQPLAVKVADKSIIEITQSNISETVVFFENIEKSLSQKQQKIGNQILKEIRSRLSFLKGVGLDYLTLDRAANTLSGGEAQRIRLATQIGSSLSGVLYVLDEPSIGLHQRDNQKLIVTLQKLKALGNTVLVVEHDEETMKTADFLVDVGPGAGKHGGHIVAAGTPQEVAKNKKSVTGDYLSGRRKINVPSKKRNGTGQFIEIKKAEANNLKKIDIKIPLGKLVCVTGVSGSGKSTLITDILSRALSQHFFNSKTVPGKHKEIKGLENLDKVITIDQSPIGRTPRSNPATYTGVFTPIRELFAQTQEAKIKGFKSGKFSFNVTGGRCEACQGDGVNKIEMNFLPDVYVECEECHGKRYNKEVLDIFYNHKNIADVLDMTVEEAMIFFKDIPAIYQKLKTLFDVGLSYMHLGQSATTLSGGEAQRIKLSSELARKSTGKTLYTLDEPTTGLHFEDIKKLLHVLHQLVDKGNSILIIEHNLDVIKSSDWVIDLGPEGGDGGGYLVAAGTPEEVSKEKKSYTGQFLKPFFKK
jgi:excinuclease ABC subunit A